MYLIKEDNFPLLFGRDWLSEFDISPYNLKSVYVNEIVNYSDKSQDLLHDFSDFFTDKAGEIKGLQAEFYLEKDDSPSVCKARTVAYELRAAVNEELKRLQYKYVY